MRAIDTNANVINIVGDIVAGNFGAVGRYYSSNTNKQLAGAEAKAISAAGLKIFVVFEDVAKPDLTYNSGQRDARIALRQAAGLSQPAGSAIYFALDYEYDTPDLDGVRDYFQGVRDAVAGQYRLGVYGDGVVCEALLDEQVCDYAWLSASRGFPGSKVFYKSKRWALAQSPNEQSVHGLNIDIDEVNGDFGGFQIGVVPVLAARATAPTATPWMDWMRQHRGEIQQTGAKPTPFTEAIFQHTTFGPLNGVTPPSCAATVCAALELNGYSSTHSAAAVSYRTYGTACALQPGCVVVFQWPAGDYHVDFCDAIIDADTVRGLGGNQGHQLQDSDYSREYIVATRWPVKSAAGPTLAFPVSLGAAPKLCTPYWQARTIRPAQSGNANAASWTVPELCKAYSWPTNLAGGGVIAIVELGGGWVQSDMEAFFKSIGQPIPQIADVSVDGTQNNPNQPVPAGLLDPDVEVALDIQVAASSYYVATRKPASIRVYWASGLGGITSAIQAATRDGCDVCSISWGWDEANWQTYGQSQNRDFIGEMEAAAQAATEAGMIVFASSGDNDSSDGGPTPANVDLPSSCPHVVGCGGTSKTATGEVVWNDDPGQTDGKGTGGGYSTVFPLQSFQVGAPPPPRAGLGRMVPDIAANADPLTGYAMVVHGLPITMGGTSAVAPLYAGLFASFGNKLGFITPRLWLNQNCFHDITVGENGEYTAQVGPDPCTGIGSPIGTKLAALFGSDAPAATLAGTAVSVMPGEWSGTVSYTYAKGILVGGPQFAPSGATQIVPRTLAAPGTFTVLQGHRYSASVTLSGLEQLASNSMIADKLTQLGFRDVTVTGSGGTRQAEGVWTGPDTTAQLDPRLGNITDLG
jgi:kumamolisin